MGLMTIASASRELGISSAHLRRMLKSGKIPGYCLGPKATRIDVDEVKKLGRLVFESKKGEGRF
jgi:excisionase family DNA binding protein